MRKLLRANFARLLRSKVFWLAVLSMAALGLYFCLDGYFRQRTSGYVYTLDTFFFMSYMVIGVAQAIFVSLFLGREYSDGTMRNKLITGAKRSHVYLANFITCAVAGLLMTLAYMIVVCAVGIPLFGLPEFSLAFLLWHLAIGAMLIIAYAAVYTLAAMLIPNKTIVAIGLLLCVVFGLMLASGIVSRLETPEFYRDFVMVGEDGHAEQFESRPNPMYLNETQRIPWELALDILPTGQSVSLAQDLVERPARMLLCSTLLSLLFTAAGVCVFRRKDLQ